MQHNLTKQADGTYSLTSAQKVGGYRPPRTRGKSSPCLVTRADGSQYVLTHNRTSARRLRSYGIEARIPEVARIKLDHDFTA